MQTSIADMNCKAAQLLQKGEYLSAINEWKQAALILRTCMTIDSGESRRFGPLSIKPVPCKASVPSLITERVFSMFDQVLAFNECSLDDSRDRCRAAAV